MEELEEWKDYPDLSTPITAARLNNMQNVLLKKIEDNKGITEFIGTQESPINANTIVNVGVYKISGSKENFYNNETETLILEVTLNNTALVQSITTADGIALRVGQNVDNAWSFGEWDVLTGEKQVGYADEKLEGTEKIIIEKSDLGGVDTVELADVVQTFEGNETDKVPSVKAVNEGLASIVETVTNENGTAIKFSDGTMICAGEILLENVNITNQDGIFYYGQLNPVNLPYTFISNPITTMEVDSVEPAYALFLRSTGNGSSLAQTPQKIITSISSVVATKLKIHYQAIGRWK